MLKKKQTNKDNGSSHNNIAQPKIDKDLISIVSSEVAKIYRELKSNAKSSSG